ncbi:MAG: SUMF1/EgtB/PvdO family nonheme iron enzyme [Pseudooceanicola sp.]|nr:SUMF1/EgtB/PvdO family nonheme iron enzyme [Pseudooceanicola sp.]
MKHLLLLLLLAAPAAAQDWPRENYDPASEGDPADLILPMPCGGAMAFQKVKVPVDAADPLADRRVRLGQTLDETGYSDYLSPAFLRGSFTDATSTYYYIARYELTEGQYRAILEDCAEPSRTDRLAKGGLSWFDAVSLARLYSEWLIATKPANLPSEDTAPAFARLPTEPEWEYATRGGARIEPTKFPDRTFFGDGDLKDYARHQAAGSGRGALSAIGLRKPNPLGLYDVYGNAEELTLEPFRLNTVGRAGGQVGGIVTRGGSVLSTPDQIYSAQRTEYPPFDPATGAPLAGATFGVRFVLATNIATSDAHLRAIKSRWDEIAGAEPDIAVSEADPLALLSGLIEAETDPGRQDALNELKLQFRRAGDRAQTAQAQSARATLLAGAVFVDSLDTNAEAIAAKAANIRMLVDLRKTGNQTAVYARQVEKHVNEIGELRSAQATYLLSYRATLESLNADIAPAVRNGAYAVLREEMTLAGRSQLLRTLDRFWADVQAYPDRPDLGPADLLALALD